jgi:hypothetical protein
MKKLSLCVFLLGFMLFSCSDNSTGPGNWSGYISDYHLIIDLNDSLLQYFPDTIARIDSAIAFDVFSEKDTSGNVSYTTNIPYDTADFTQIVGKGKLILKEDLGKTSDVIDPEKELFSIDYLEDIPSSWLGTPSIEIYVTSFDSNHYFHEDIIRASFFSYDYSSDIDSIVKYQIPLYLTKEGNKIKIDATNFTSYEL